MGVVAVGAAGRPAVAILTFENPSNNDDVRWLARGLPSMLVTGLAQTPGLDVVSSQRVDEILKELGQQSADADKSRILEIGRRAGAGALVMGSVFKTGNDVRVEVQVQEVASGRVLGAHRVQGTDVFPMADDLTSRIRNSLNLNGGESGRKIAEVTSGSLEAYRLYTEGLEAFSNLRFPDALKPLEKAVAIDPGFASAYFQLEQVARQMSDAAASEEYHLKTKQHLDRLPERQRLFFESNEARSRGRVDQAVSLLETLITRYPDETQAYWRLANNYDQDMADLPKALATIERGIKANPSSGPLHNLLGYGYLRMGRYPEAFREFDEYARLNPKEPNPYDSQAEAYLFTGQPDKALERYSRILELDPNFINARAGRTFAFGIMGKYPEAIAEGAKLQEDAERLGFPQATGALLQAVMLARVGRHTDARRQIAEGVQDAGRVKNLALTAELHVLSGIIAIDRRDFATARASLAAAERLVSAISDARDRRGPARHIVFFDGLLKARSGDLDGARTRLEEHKKLHDPKQVDETWDHHVLEAEIALAGGDPSAAESAIAKGEPELHMFFNMGSTVYTLFANELSVRDTAARARVARGDLAGAIEAYRKILAVDITQKWTAMLEPRYVLALARLLDQQGDKAGARKEYQRFLELWKDADPGQPEVAEAKRKVVSS